MATELVLSVLEEGTYIVIPCEEDDVLFIEERLKEKDKKAQFKQYKIGQVIAYGDPFTYNDADAETELQNRDIQYYIGRFHQHGHEYCKCVQPDKHWSNWHTTGMLAWECFIEALGSPAYVVIILIPHPPKNVPNQDSDSRVSQGS